MDSNEKSGEAGMATEVGAGDETMGEGAGSSTSRAFSTTSGSTTLASTLGTGAATSLTAAAVCDSSSTAENEDSAGMMMEGSSSWGRGLATLDEFTKTSSIATVDASCSPSLFFPITCCVTSISM